MSKNQTATRPCACGCGQHPKGWDAQYVAGHRPPRPLAERLWSRIRKTDGGCWEFTGACHPTRGYGQLGRGRRGEGLVDAHRAAWEVTYGPIPDGLVVRHKCDNRPCCNPDHLELGTHQDNSDDKVTRNRQARGRALPQSRLSDEQVRSIRSRYVAQFGPPKLGGRASNAQLLADEFGVSRSYVMQLAHGHFRKDVK